MMTTTERIRALSTGQAAWGSYEPLWRNVDFNAKPQLIKQPKWDWVDRVDDYVEYTVIRRITNGLHRVRRALVWVLRRMKPQQFELREGRLK